MLSMLRRLAGFGLVVLVGCMIAVSPCSAAYKIGAVFSVTGRASFLGDPEEKTIKMVVEQLNAAGGVNGQKIDLIIYDDEADATKCNLFVKKLITRDKVSAIIGPSLSGTSLAVIPLAEKYKTPLISCAASYKIVHNEKTGKPYPWVFKTPQSDSLAVEAIFTHMRGKGIGKIGVLSVTSGYGASGREEIIRLAPEYGVQVVADEKYDTKDTDMTAQLTKIKALAPEAIINWSIGPTQVTVLRNWRDLAMDKMFFYQSHGFGSKKNIELAAKTAEGVFCPLGACSIAEQLPLDHPQKKIAAQYRDDYKARYNEPVSAFGGYAWDAIHLLLDALKAVGDNKAKIRNHIENKKNFTGQHGIFNFSPQDHNGLTKQAFQMVVVKDGDWAMAQ